ncbi:general substrate transporter [Blastocladiella britannica]|nr:general substrate transporter [Blastocladiella britannica]
MISLPLSSANRRLRKQVKNWCSATRHRLESLPPRPNQAKSTGQSKMPAAAAYSVRLYYSAIVATMGFFAYGYHLGEFNNISTLLPCKDPNWPETAPPEPYLGISLPVCIPMTRVQFSFANAIFPLAGVLGAMASGPMSHSLGRVRAMMYLTLPLALSPIALALANNYAWLLVGRILAGIGAIGFSTIVPVYLSEISPPHLRGRVGNISSAMINVGLAIASLTGWFWAASAPSWRSIVGFTLLTSVVQMVGLYFCAESPAWLEGAGRRAEADAVRRSLGHDLTLVAMHDDIELDRANAASGSEGDESKGLSLPPPHTEEEATPRTESMSVLQLLRDPEYRRSIVILVLAHSAQQLSGINTYFVYSFFILTLVLTPEQAGVFYLAFAFCNIPINYFPGLIVDRFGRRPLILGTMAAMSLCAALFTVSVVIKAPVMSIIMFVGAVTVFALGLSNVPFILMGEVTDARSVAAASTVALVTNTLSSFVVLFVFPLLLDSLHEYTFLFFAGYLAISGVALAAVLPETRGRSNPDVMAELKLGIRWTRTAVAG